MEKLHERIQLANKMLDTFEEIVDIEAPSEIECDAAIHRFRISVEVCWKVGKQFLFDLEGLDIGSPKGVIRSFREVGVFSEDEAILGLHMIDDRNLTVHTYNEELSIEIFGKLPAYYRFLKVWMDRLANKAFKA